MSPRPMRRYVAPRLVCFVCGKAISGETRMVGYELAHPGCAALRKAGKA